MCGIAGIFAPDANLEWKERIFRKLLFASQQRGTDATGIAFIGQDGKLVVDKEGVRASEFISKSETMKGLKTYFPSLIIGHTRAATRGSGGPTENRNNHPFVSDVMGVALIHNGLISNDDDWRKTVGKPNGLINTPESDVDSEVMLRAIETFYLRHLEDENYSFENCIDDATYCVAGSYALAIVKEDSPTDLWLVRHKSPIAIAWVPKHKAIVFASTVAILEAALSHTRYVMDFFNETTVTKSVINEISDDQLVHITYIGDEKAPFCIDVKNLECSPEPGRMAEEKEIDAEITQEIEQY